MIRSRIRAGIVRWLERERALFDRPITAFDIETVPDPDLGRRLQGIEGTDAEVVREMVRRRREESDGKKEYPHLPLHRVVSCCVTTLDPKTARVTIRELGDDTDWRDERSRVEGFFQLDGRARLLSWNGKGFDLPVLRYRAMLLGVVSPHHERTHIDVMDLLSDEGASPRVGLNTLASVVGLPGKRFLARPVYEHVLEGEAHRVIEYCKLDTVMTLLLFLLWAFHAGHISKDETRRYVDGVRASVANLALTFDGWREIEPVLANWPHGV